MNRIHRTFPTVAFALCLAVLSSACSVFDPFSTTFRGSMSEPSVCSRMLCASAVSSAGWNRSHQDSVIRVRVLANAQVVMLTTSGRGAEDWRALSPELRRENV